VVGPGRMRQRFVEESPVFESIAEDCLTVGGRPEVIPMNRWGHGRTKKVLKELRRRTDRL